MNEPLNPEKDIKKSRKSKQSKQSNQFSQKTVFVREDDQDWGSAGMNDIQTVSESNH
jgi:hypothetical protein